tara:strand:- start:353 stop:466 length:114 start_codon:yes stop_codon:yes gene_type:complete
LEVVQMSICKNYFKNKKDYKNTEWLDDLINKLIKNKK